MGYSLAIAFLFYIGAISGWVIEFFYRNLISHNGPRGKYFINPGFCKGPWLPIYGIGLSTMFMISWFVTKNITEKGILTDITVIIMIMLVMVGIEFIGGLFLLKVMNMRLWDYRDQKGNILGIVCPQFTLIWGGLGAIYYLFIHEIALEELQWLSNNLAFSFVIGLFFGFFIIDLVFSAKDAIAIRKYGVNNDVIIKLEELKALLVEKEKEIAGKQKSFVNQTKLKYEQLHNTLDNFESILEDKKIVFEKKVKSIK